MKKILHYIPAFDHGGIESRLIDWYENLDKSKYKFYVLTYRNNSHKNDILEHFVNLGGEVIYIEPLKYKNYKLSLKTLGKIFTDYKFDVVHCHSLATSNIILKVARKNNIKVRIFHSRTNQLEDTGVRKVVKNILIRNAIKNSTKLLACSKTAGSWIYKNREFEILENGISHEKFSFNHLKGNYVRKELGIDDDTYVIGYTARLTKSKNHIFLIEILEHFVFKKGINNIHLLFVGDGPEKEELLRILIEKKLDIYVIFTGRILGVEKYYLAMDIFVFPSFYEGFGTVAVEAQASGLPTIISAGVPDDVIVLQDLVKKLKLNTGVEKWCEAIEGFMDSRFTNRENYSQTFKNSSLELGNTIRKLVRIYG